MISVSIITPVFNRQEDIKKLVESVFLQSHSNWELILVDDGSEDESLVVAEKFAASDDRIISVKREKSPKGAPVCRNIGIEMARGRYLMFLDSDDLLSHHCLENRLNLMETHNEDDFIVTQTGIIRRDSLKVTKLWNSLKHEDDIEAFSKLQGWCISSTFFKTSFIKKYRFDENAPCLQDWEFHLGILIDKPKYTKFPYSEVDVYIRSGHGGTRISITTNNIERLIPRFKVFLEMEKRLQVSSNDRYIRHFDKHYLKHLNFAALELESSHFTDLFELWEKSHTYGLRNGRLIKTYLRWQFYLRKLRFSPLHGVLYRLAKFLYPAYLFAPNGREVIIERPQLVEPKIQKILNPRG